MQNIYAKSRQTFRRFETSGKFFPNVYAILHKLLGNKKAKEMLTSAACPLREMRKICAFVHICFAHLNMHAKHLPNIINPQKTCQSWPQSANQMNIIYHTSLIKVLVIHPVFSIYYPDLHLMSYQ